MFEIEAKVAISKKEAEEINKKLAGMESYTKSLDQKDDFYYGEDNAYFRLRKSPDKNQLTFKYKKRKKGIEENQEIECIVHSAQEWCQLMEKLKIPLMVRKQKNSIIYKKGNTAIEINEVKGLGYFLEIEIITPDKSELKKVKKELIKTFNELGFSKRQFDKKYYLEHLKDKAL